jgi:OmpA-OmpF porin, OOP family
MAAQRTLACLVFALAAILPAWAQAQPQAFPAVATGSLRLSGHPAGQLGLNLDRSAYSFPCSSTALLCDQNDRALKLYAGAMVGNFWGVELGYLDVGRATWAASDNVARGLNLSLVGKAPLWQGIGIHGRLGTTLGRSEHAALAGLGGAGERGFGLSYGAGVSVAFTPRLSATLEWDSNDFRFAGSAGDPVRSTSLGLQYRY